jgi:hypothetical protein
VHVLPSGGSRISGHALLRSLNLAPMVTLSWEAQTDSDSGLMFVDLTEAGRPTGYKPRPARAKT